MGYIYLITNNVNGNKYVGKTELSIEERWGQHIKDSKKEKCEIRPLYRAIRKYGVENFSIKEIDTGQGEELNNKEQYWIQYYDTYKNWYNATLGGDGKILLDYDEIIKTYLLNHNATEVARTLGCSADSVYKILKANDVPITKNTEIITEKYAKEIVQYDKKGNFIQTHRSAHDAARVLGDERYRQHIQECLKGKRKSAYGYLWRYKDN